MHCSRCWASCWDITLGIYLAEGTCAMENHGLARDVFGWIVVVVGDGRGAGGALPDVDDEACCNKCLKEGGGMMMINVSSRCAI
jgi:hypothetical protein